MGRGRAIAPRPVASRALRPVGSKGTVAISRCPAALVTCATPAARLHAMLAKCHAELQREQLVELQPLEAAPSSSATRGNGCAGSPGRTTEGLGANDVVWERVGDRWQALEGAEHELADRPGRHAFGGPVDRRDAAGVHHVRLSPPQDLHLVVRHLPLAPVHGDRAGHRELLPLLVQRRRPRLVEEREVEVARAVVQGDRHHVCRRRVWRFVVLPHRGDDRCLLSHPELADRRDPRSVDVAAGVVMEQIPTVRMSKPARTSAAGGPLSRNPARRIASARSMARSAKRASGRQGRRRAAHALVLPCTSCRSTAMAARPPLLALAGLRRGVARAGRRTPVPAGTRRPRCCPFRRRAALRSTSEPSSGSSPSWRERPWW